MITDPQKFLLSWYLKNKRDLPFRKSKDPYRIWISEVMLQQTRVNSMLLSYIKFIDQFPNIKTLAKSTEEKVIQYWKGLGYYSRARNLLKGAKFIVENYNSEFPNDIDKILKIPGIGNYTARAILSISYNLPYAVLDGNVKRVLSRMYNYNNNLTLSKSIDDLQELADRFLNIESAGDHNQAMMELGATICTPTPNCKICPLNNYCIAYKNNNQLKLPVIKKEKDKIKIEMRYFLLLDYTNRVLLVKDKKRRFFKTIPCLPYLIYGDSLDETYLEKDPQIDKFLRSIKIKPCFLKKKHTITHHDISISLIIDRIDNHPFSPDDSLFVSLENLPDAFPSSISTKIFNYIQSEKSNLISTISVDLN